ncbi:hypothetical protein PS9374_06660 [Planomonospora sphaerica]|uniref:Uncharacterized protein n=1 Tax=Planomonospora sphaerica TaxID=161355 RepID=A0A171DPJ6_9ACTN|nr:hypothetical protein PS9374_06660 [Planomonospora sphaerica]
MTESDQVRVPFKSFPHAISIENVPGTGGAFVPEPRWDE